MERLLYYVSMGAMLVGCMVALDLIFKQGAFAPQWGVAGADDAPAQQVPVEQPDGGGE